MKVLYSVVFSMLALAGILKDLTVYVSFKANQEYISVTMCTSRDDPDNACNGSCYLTKQLEMVHNHGQESDSQTPPKLNEHINFYLEEISEEIEPSFIINDFYTSELLAVKTKQGFPRGIFEPPKNS